MSGESIYGESTRGESAKRIEPEQTDVTADIFTQQADTQSQHSRTEAFGDNGVSCEHSHESFTAENPTVLGLIKDKKFWVRAAKDVIKRVRKGGATFDGRDF